MGILSIIMSDSPSPASSSSFDPCFIVEGGFRSSSEIWNGVAMMVMVMMMHPRTHPSRQVRKSRRGERRPESVARTSLHGVLRAGVHGGGPYDAAAEHGGVQIVQDLGGSLRMGHEGAVRAPPAASSLADHSRVIPVVEQHRETASPVQRRIDPTPIPVVEVSSRTGSSRDVGPHGGPPGVTAPRSGTSMVGRVARHVNGAGNAAARRCCIAVVAEVVDSNGADRIAPRSVAVAVVVPVGGERVAVRVRDEGGCGGVEQRFWKMMMMIDPRHRVLPVVILGPFPVLLLLLLLRIIRVQLIFRVIIIVYVTINVLVRIVFLRILFLLVIRLFHVLLRLLLLLV
mmetsp:Transcript_29264/g.70603  ORF Transcript_29264/g.70603 Transcript_29264/m.70603 type:complete len:342 (+) Transcript_29264:287-1312(+)